MAKADLIDKAEKAEKEEDKKAKETEAKAEKADKEPAAESKKVVDEDLDKGPGAGTAKGVGQFINETRRVLRAQKKRKIVIPSTEREKDAVVVSINGYVYNIPRDKEVEVPDGVIEVLRNARIKSYSVRKREEGEGNELIEQEVARVPFQTVE